MKLEMGYINIHDIQFSNVSKVENGVLYRQSGSCQEARAWRMRIMQVGAPWTSHTPVRASASPRLRMSSSPASRLRAPAAFSRASSPRLTLLAAARPMLCKGMAVVTAGKIVGFQEGIIDMSGPGADYTPFSQAATTSSWSASRSTASNSMTMSSAVRMAGFKAAVYLGELARRTAPPMRPEIFETYGDQGGH